MSCFVFISAKLFVKRDINFARIRARNARHASLLRASRVSYIVCGILRARISKRIRSINLIGCSRWGINSSFRGCWEVGEGFCHWGVCFLLIFCVCFGDCRAAWLWVIIISSYAVYIMSTCVPCINYYVCFYFALEWYSPEFEFILYQCKEYQFWNLLLTNSFWLTISYYLKIFWLFQYCIYRFLDII